MTFIPRGVAAITTGWLEEVLDERLRCGASIVGVRAENIGDGIGFMGEVARLHLEYDRDVPAALRTVIAKTPTTIDELRHIGSHYGLYEKEHGFYAHLAGDVGIDVPHAYVNLGSAETGGYVLLLEDLGHMRAGDQLESCTLDEAVEILQRVARLHAAWWEDPRLDDHAHWLPGPGSAYFDIIKGAYLEAVQTPGEMGALIPDWAHALAATMADRYDELFDRGAARRPHTLVHGDFRLDNMMFGRDGDARSFVLIDWQLPMRLNPMFEVMYFCAGSVDMEMRRRDERTLIGSYHAALVEAGVSGYSLDECWAHYEMASVGMLGYLVPLVAQVQLDNLNERGRTMMITLMQRYVAAIDDHRHSAPVLEVLATTV
jgi:hypothetical protein